MLSEQSCQLLGASLGEDLLRLPRLRRFGATGMPSCSRAALVRLCISGYFFRNDTASDFLLPLTPFIRPVGQLCLSKLVANNIGFAITVYIVLREDSGVPKKLGILNAC